MAALDKKFSQLPPVVVPAPTDQLAVNQGGVSKRQTRQQIHELQTNEALILPLGDFGFEPRLFFRDSGAGSNAGFSSPSFDVLEVLLDSSKKFHFVFDLFGGSSSGSGGITNGGSTFTTPSIIPKEIISGVGQGAGIGTGMGSGVVGSVSLIGENIEGLRFTEGSGQIIQKNSVDAGLTAGTTQTQAGGLKLLSSYNEVATVANLDDAVVAPTVGPGVRFLVINNGAFRLQLFPDVGDDIGAGVDAAITIEAGEVAEFIGQTAIIWDTLFNGAASGGGGVAISGTPVNNQLGIWTDASTQEGDANITWNGGTLDVAGTIRAVGVGGFTNRAGIRNAQPSGSVPNIHPNMSDLTTGIGSSAVRKLNLIVSNFSGLIISDNGGSDLTYQYFLQTVAASTEQTQGQASTSSSYVRVTTVVNDNDVITLLPVGKLGFPVLVINEGAKILQIFPESGSDLGDGVNISMTLAPGGSVLFMGTSSTQWRRTSVFEPGAGGGGDVTKVGTPVNNQIGVWTGDGTIEGDSNLTWTGTVFEVGGTIQVSNASGSALLNEVSSNTNPTLVPNNQSPSSGLGGISGQPSLIANGKSGMSVSEAGGAAKIGFYDGSPIALQTGVSVTTSAIHAALVALRLITA